jgi:hypothetical protein
VRGRERAVTVSVIIPAYNIETYLGPCLDSILRQTYEDFEVPGGRRWIYRCNRRRGPALQLR